MENNNFIITVNREAGSGGGDIAKIVGELLGVKVYDKEILSGIRKQYHLTEDQIEQIKAKKASWWSEFCRFYKQFGSAADGADESSEVNSLQLYYEEAKILKALANQESCVILGRTGFHIFKDYPNAMRIFITANKDVRAKWIMKKFDLDVNKAIKKMEEIDTARENYTKTFANVSRYDARNYDLCINVSGFTPEQVAHFIANNVRLKYSEDK